MNRPPSLAGPHDRGPVDWAQAELPDAWPDRLPWRRLAHPWRVALAVRRKQARRVVLPEGMPGSEVLPKYLLQEFHNLPNGNYSKSITGGYARAFDAVMLWTMQRARRQIAERLRGSRRALDIGSGAGNLARALLDAGIPEVVALEPSPYLLRISARRNPRARCVQGVIESSGLPDGHFDGAGACFVFHEVPPLAADKALQELHRLLVPGGRLAVVEPSPEQWHSTRREMWRAHGWRGVYFRELALRVHEPFVKSWHRRDPRQWLEAGGFRFEEQVDEMPWRMLVARRP